MSKMKIVPPVGMLPPENPPVVHKPGSSKETVNQRKMREAMETMEEFKKWKTKYYEKYDDIKQLIQSGAEIQEGRIGARHGIRFVRRPRYKQILIDLKGEAYQQRVLENTAPHAHFYVRLIPPKK